MVTGSNMVCSSVFMTYNRVNNFHTNTQKICIMNETPNNDHCKDPDVPPSCPTISWASDPSCNGGGTVTVSVKGNGSQMVKFNSSNGVSRQPANLGNNQYKTSVPYDGTVVYWSARVDGCPQID
jgi:hypothetical protein